VSIFRRSLSREFTSVGAAVLSVLVAIFVVFTLVRLLGRVADGVDEAEAVTALLGFGLLGYFPVMMALASFVAILMTLSRSYRDSEMPVWFSSGLSLAAWVRPVLTFSGPIVVITAFMSLVLTPWAIEQSREYQRLLRSRDDASRLTPGSFIQTSDGSLVFFVDKTVSDSDVFNNVFGQFNQHGRFGVIVAEKGFQKVEANGDKFLVLQNGRRYEGTPSALDFRIVDFERQMIRIQPKEAAAGDPSPRALTTPALLAQPSAENIAELHWRIALPIAALLLSLLAIPLSFVNPRSGASWNLILAVLIFFLYYNLLGVSQGWTAGGRIPPWLGLVPVHIGIIAILVTLFSRQLFSFSWLAFARRSLSKT
jgi:lipopolysaccharide export system permease protein